MCIIQLAEKMRRRGQRVDAGERLEYLVTDMDNIKAKLWRKLEHPVYFKNKSLMQDFDECHKKGLLNEVINFLPVDDIFVTVSLDATFDVCRIARSHGGFGH